MQQTKKPIMGKLGWKMKCFFARTDTVLLVRDPEKLYYRRLEGISIDEKSHVGIVLRRSGLDDCDYLARRFAPNERVHSSRTARRVEVWVFCTSRNCVFAESKKVEWQVIAKDVNSDRFTGCRDVSLFVLRAIKDVEEELANLIAKA